MRNLLVINKPLAYHRLKVKRIQVASPRLTGWCWYEGLHALHIADTAAACVVLPQMVP